MNRKTWKICAALLVTGLSACGSDSDSLEAERQRIDVTPAGGLGTLVLALPDLSAHPGAQTAGIGAPRIDGRTVDFNRAYAVSAGAHCVSVPHGWSNPSWRSDSAFRSCDVAVASHQETRLVLAGLRLSWDPAITAVDVGARAQLELRQPANDTPLVIELDAAGSGNDRVYFLPPGSYQVHHAVPRAADLFGEPVVIHLRAGEVTAVDVTPADQRSRLTLHREDAPPPFPLAANNRIELRTFRSGYPANQAEMPAQAASHTFRFFASTDDYTFQLQVNGLSERLAPAPGQEITRTLQLISVHDLGGETAGFFTVEYQRNNRWDTFLGRSPTSRSFDVLPGHRYRIRTGLVDGFGNDVIADERVLDL